MHSPNRPQSDDVERTHHFVVFVFENVTMPDVSSGKITERCDDASNLSRWASHDVFPCGFSGLGLHCRAGELDRAGRIVCIDVKWLPVEELKVNQVEMDRMV